MDEHRRKLVAIVFTDIVGFTEITSSDEGKAIRLLQWQRNTFQPMVEEHGGEWVKELGDGLLLSFPSSQDAVRCAIRIQEATREKPDLQIRIGIHQGDIIQEGPDILGEGVNIAARLQQIAPRGGIALSDKVQQDISGYPEFEVISLGQHSLKGVARSMEIYGLSPFGFPEIPEYRLLRLTGQGAYGEVWLAQSLTGVYRAVKIVHRDQFEDAKPYEREFTGITEYEPVSRKHEGLIDLLHVGHGQDDNFFYYVMELADDQRAREEINPREYRPRTLQSELEARGKLSIGECLEVGSRLARGLAFLHDHNLLHRDVKPANIVYVDGHPKLADIGLVTTMDNASTLVGTMGYIPPEGPGKPSSDIYALGMVLYELGTGKDRADFPEIDVMDPALKGLNQVFLKACSNDLNERFCDANALADKLDQLALEPIGGASTSASSGGSYKVAALAASLLLILALIFLSREKKSDIAQNNPPTQSLQKPEGNTAGGKRPTGEPSGTVDLSKGLEAYYPFNGNANDESGNGNDGKIKGATLTTDRHGKNGKAFNFDGVDDLISVSEAEGFGGNAHTLALWVKTDDARASVLLSKDGETRDARQWQIGRARGQIQANIWTTSGEKILEKSDLQYPSWKQVIQTWNGEVLKLFINGQFMAEISAPGQLASSDEPVRIGAGKDRYFFKGAIDDVRIYNRALSADEVTELYELEKPKDVELRERLTIKGGANQRWGIGMDEKGERLAAATGRAIKIWNIADGKEIFNYPIKQFTSMAYDPKGKWLAHSHGKAIDLIDSKTGKISFTLPDDGGNRQSLAFHPDGKVLAVSRRDGKTRLWDLANRKQAGELYAFGSNAVTYSPDGRWLADHSEGQLRVWELPFREHVLFTYGAYTQQIAWSPDSKLIAAALGKAPGIPGNIYVWDIPGKKRVLELKGHQNTVSAVVFSPDGKMLASSGEGDGGAQDTSIRFWDLANGRELLKNEAHKSNVFHLAFTPDGKGLVSTSMDGITKVWEIVPADK